MSFTAEGDAGKSISVKAAGQTFTADLTGAEEEYEYKLTLDEAPADTDIAICVEEPGVFYIDNVRIVEDSLIKTPDTNRMLTAAFPQMSPMWWTA